MATLRGSCLCGDVKFGVTEPLEHLRYCHCESCKRVPAEAIRIVAGEELIRTYQPKEGSSKTFCSVCGSNLFGGGWPDSPVVSVRLSALDDAFEQRPEAHIFVRSVAAWETIPDDGLDSFK